VQDLKAQREKLLANAADCELIANLASEQKKRATFRQLAEQLHQMAAELGKEIAAREALDAEH
jgi:hypothetical protein